MISANIARFVKFLLRHSLNSARWITFVIGLLGLALALIVLLIYGLSSTRNQNDYPTPNQLVFPNTAPPEGSNRAKISPSYMPVTQPFIGIAMSGGGSRSANFAWAVTRELDRIGLLEHTEAISSISGGSIAAAYLAMNLNGAPDDLFWQKGYEVLGYPFIDDLRSRAFSPGPVIRSITSPYSRGDMWAEVLDNKLTNGARFRDLAQKNIIDVEAPRYRPGLFINATAVNDPFIIRTSLQNDPRLPSGDYMGAFTFSAERLRLMSSDVGSIPLSYAVAASSAFPGAINPISLVAADYTSGGKISQNGQEWETKNSFHAKRYVHLADGGLSDNLGTDTLRKVFEGRSEYQRDIDDKSITRPCLMIVIDATTPPNSAPRDAALSRDARSTWWSSIVDATMVNGYDAYLLRRRLDQLDELGLDPTGVDYGSVRMSRPSATQNITVRHRYSRYQEKNGYVASPSVFVRSQQLAGAQGKLRHDLTSYSCQIWHIALEDIQLQFNTNYYKAEEKPEKLRLHRQNEYRSSFAPTVLSLATDLKLRSKISPECTPGELQSMLTFSARELVYNTGAKKPICDWMKSAGLNAQKCDASQAADYGSVPSCARKPDEAWLKYLRVERQNSIPKACGKPVCP
jgi:NTE family protein